MILLIFKYINDVFGYKYGDEILINYAATISNELRTGEVLGRVSADNFVICVTIMRKTTLWSGSSRSISK